MLIVVLGVGIALLAQQWVENRSWTARVERAERQLANETSGNFFFGAERITVRPCVDAQLDRLIAAAMEPAARNVPQPAVVSGLGTYALRQPNRPFDTTAWRGIVGDGVAAHFDEDRRDLFSEAYNQIAGLDPMTEQSQILATGLSGLLFPIEMTADIRERMIERAMALKANNNLMALMSAQLMVNLDALGAAPSKAEIDAQIARGNSRTVTFCRERGLPLGDWHRELMKERAEAIRTGDLVGRYRNPRAQ
ncbi:hypothetical protein [Sphingomonas mesophila]|uniref:hypothetical protein n=1 Tax=Sphingomonas mesophila TaxID=2303576 RepID=UPI0013C373F9|nr:hypothetical protein [Sphingomonas mesophila]